MRVRSAFSVPAIYYFNTEGVRVGGVDRGTRRRLNIVFSSSAARTVARKATGQGGGMQVSERDNVSIDDSKVSERDIVSINDSNNVVGSKSAPTSASNESAAIGLQVGRPPCEERLQGNAEAAEGREDGVAAMEIAGAVTCEVAAAI